LFFYTRSSLESGQRFRFERRFEGFQVKCLVLIGIARVYLRIFIYAGPYIWPGRKFRFLGFWGLVGRSLLEVCGAVMGLVVMAIFCV